MQNEELKTLYKMLEQLSSLNKGRKFSRVVKELRACIRRQITIDPYIHRGNSKESYYCNIAKGKRLFVTIGNMQDFERYTVVASNIWLDNYRAWREGKCDKLYEKEYYFRIDNDFYKKDEFIEKDGKAYSKDKWVEFDGKLVEKSKVCTCKYSTYGYNRPIFHEIALKANEGEEFIEKNHTDNAKVVIEVSSYGTGMRCNNFVKSMFRIGNKRLSPAGFSSIQLTKEELNNFNLKISDSHLIEVAKDVIEEITPEEQKKKAEKIILKGLDSTCFRIKLVDDVKNNSLKNRLLNMIVNRLSRRRYNDSFCGVKELFCRLRAIKSMYEVEAEYAK